MATIKPLKGEALAVFVKKNGESTYTMIATATEFNYDVTVEDGENVMLLTGTPDAASWATPTDGGVSWSGSMSVINTFDENDFSPKVLEYINSGEILDLKLAKLKTAAPDEASMHVSGQIKFRNISAAVPAGGNITGSYNFTGYGPLTIGPTPPTATATAAAKESAKNGK